MRFHIGFSKFIKPKTLIEILGLLFLGSLAFFGIYQHEVLALTDTLDISLYSNDYYVTGYNKTSRNGTMEETYSETTSSLDFTSENNTSFNFPNNNYTLIANRNYWAVFNTISIDIDHNYCSNDNTSKSVNLLYTIRTRSYDYLDNFLESKLITTSDISDIVSFYIEPQYNNATGPLAQYACHLQNWIPTSEGSTYGTYDVYCERIPILNVTGYKLFYYNKLLRTLESVEALNFTDGTSQLAFMYGLMKNSEYECSTQNPISQNEFQFPSDALGTSSVETEQTLEGSIESLVHFSDYNIGFVDEITIPERIQNLITIPFRLIGLLNRENASTVCQPISLNLSSITRRYGGFDYSLQIPCMRAYLDNLLDFNIIGTMNFYEMLDLFIGFGLTLKLGEYLLKIIRSLFSGEDIGKLLDSFGGVS